MGGIHVEVQQQGQLLEGRMAQQLGLVADENRMLLFALVEMPVTANVTGLGPEFTRTVPANSITVRELNGK